MDVLIGSSVYITEPTPEIKEYCKDNLTIDNPDYLSALKANRWTGNIPKQICLYENRGDTLVVPYGFKDEITRVADVKARWIPYRTRKNYEANYFSSIKPYPYQDSVIHRMIKKKNGVVVMPCGSGKTQTALECVNILGLKTLWLTHTQDLLNQSMERAKSCFNCTPDMFGTITAGKVNISKGITFATVQTMCKLDLSKYTCEWAVVIVDECQHCCGSPTRVTQFYKVVNSLYAPYKFGLTATPHRNDGLDRSMYTLLGGMIADVRKEDIAENLCPVKIKAFETGYYPDCDVVINCDGTINYNALMNDLISNRIRFMQLADVINSTCGSHSMVLANRVQYLQKLQEVYVGKSICISSTGTSQKAKQERKEALRKLNCGEIDCIFATYQLAAEGLDCPNLRYVVFATPEKNERTITQAVGRVSRKADGKDFGTVIDFIDDFGMYRSWYMKRSRYYSKLDCLLDDN